MSYKRTTFFISQDNILSVGNYEKKRSNSFFELPDGLEDEDYIKISNSYKEEAEKFVDLIEDDSCDSFLMELIEASFKKLKQHDEEFRKNSKNDYLTHVNLLNRLNNIVKE